MTKTKTPKIRHTNFKTMDELITFVKKEKVKIISVVKRGIKETEEYILIYGVRSK